MCNLKIYEKKVIINSRDVDGTGQCKASALLAYLQDASAEHTTICGCGRREMVDNYNVFWMLTRIQVQLYRPVMWLDELVIRTGHRPGKGILFYRDYELWVGKDQIGFACALWVLPDLKTRKLLNITQTPIIQLDHTAGGIIPKIRRLTALHTPKKLEFAENRLMRYSDTDVNAHVNNTRYADFASDIFKLDQSLMNKFYSLIEITYHEECQSGELIRMSTSRVGVDLFLHGEGMDNASRFDIRMQFQENTGKNNL